MADMRLPSGVEGLCDVRFSEVAQLVGRQLESGAHHGAGVAVRHRGRSVVDIWGGHRRSIHHERESPWTRDTMAVSFSTTKGPAATALHMVMERSGTAYDTPVSVVWPEFGKQHVTIRHVLCHEAGVPQIRDEVPDMSSLADWSAMVAMMERLEPLWVPGTANGYHAVNFGWMVGELVRRIDGRDLSTFLAEEISGPLELDGFFIGTPESEHHRVARLESPKVKASERVRTAVTDPSSLTARALGPKGNLAAFLNTPAGLATCGPAFSGAFTARSLAKFYAAVADDQGGGVRLLSPATLAVATAVQNTRKDLVLLMPMYWRLGFMGGGSERSPAGPNREAFGHAGFGGSIAVADPKAEVSVAVVLDRLELSLLPSVRVSEVVRAAISAASG